MQLPGVLTGISKVLRIIAAARAYGPLKLFPSAEEFPITEETRLVLLVLFAGALGSYIHAIKSLLDYIGNRALTASWFWFYLARPFVGMALALIFYAVIRGGFVAGTPADAKSVNPFGVVALAGLVGMFADKASTKLSDIFDALFTTKAGDSRPDKLSPLKIETETLKDATKGQPYNQAVTATGGQTKHTWSAEGLPKGIDIGADIGVLSGRAEQDGDFQVTITVKDQGGAAVQRHYTLKVAQAPQQ